ncbi:WASH complex subunit 2C isoform X4 [Malaclemys terrapin pileata]|uniref:WASH complex subunit 2C isoform X4 n=1 Tax=Malaclemys terrapin pileata TaxID=2991368 RepID=UPI0023A835C3|nr:WASH complex subunit 2C isoform X4 [Malaclemys terrapin pileata]
MERAEPVWERAWALDEIRKGSQSWSLAADAGLLHFLQEFSQQTISRTHEIKKQVDGLIHETKATDSRLRNVFNDFLMLSNTQFIENRVYDEEVEESIPKTEIGDKAEQEKTREQKEADLIPKIQEAVNYGLQVLDSAFEQLDIKAGNSDSEEEETNERVELILEPKDLYIDRPLPYLIGSQLFMERDDVGLGDFSSEEGSVDSDRGSVIDSEEKDDEESDDEFENPSEDDQKPRRTLVSDEEEEENGCDLFGDSEKEEEDLEENTRPKKKRPTSFADELAARIKGDVPSKQDEEQSSLSAEIKTKKTVKEKKEVRVPSDDDEDDIFKPPKLTDEDFSPFGSKGGLFSGGMGLFDDDEENDLFAEAPRGDDSKEKELRAPINDEPSTKALRKVPAGAVSLFPGGNDVFSSASVLVEKENKKPVEQSADKGPKQPEKVSLFDDDDDFFVEPTNKHLKSVKSTADFFDNDDGDLFKKKPEVVPAAVIKAAEGRKESMGGKKSQPSSTEDSKSLSDILPKNQRGLFSDEEDSEDLFSSSQMGKSKSTSLPPSKSATKTPLSLFDDEDEEDLFGTAPAKKQQSKPPQEKAKQSELLKKASGSLFSSDEEDHWNVSKLTKSISEDSRKGEPAKPRSAVDPANVVKKTSLFEEDEEEEDLFAITKDSQRKHQKASLLFEEDAVNGGPLFSSQPTRVPSAAKTTVEKPKTPQAPPSLFDEETEKEDLLDTSKTKLVEDKSGRLVEHRAVPVTGGTEVAGQQKKEKLEPFVASSLGPISNLDLFTASPPPLEREAKTRAKNVLSLFEEEEVEKMEDQDISKIEQKEIRKPAEKSSHSKSTGVFQDEELLFSHKLQKDNDPDVDLFASPKKSESAKLRVKLSSAGGLFGDDDEDDLFSIAKAKPPKVAEKKTIVKKDSSGPSVESNKGPENILSAKQDAVPKPETTEKSTGPALIKTKEPSSRIGKLQANLAINPAALLPSAVPKISSVKPALPNLETPLHEPDGVRSAEIFSAAGNSEEAGVSFDHPIQVDTLRSANKTRIKVMNKRRPPSRTARRLAAQESSENEELNSTEELQLPLPKQSSALVDAKGLCTAEPNAKGSTENILVAKLPSPTDGGSLSPGMAGSPSGKGIGQEDDLFGSNYLFVKNSVSKPAAKAKTPEILASNPLKSGEKKSALSVQDDQGSNDLFQPIMQKASKKSSPISFLEDEDLFTSQKTVRKKELKPTTQQDLDPKAQDIFEDDIFATEAIKPLNRTKERVTDSNLFDENTDIFADLTIKPKEKKTKKKVESKSIFDDDMDDIFSSSSQTKVSTPKGRSSQMASESKSESKASSTFDDPLNAFGGQ